MFAVAAVALCIAACSSNDAQSASEPKGPQTAEEYAKAMNEAQSEIDEAHSHADYDAMLKATDKRDALYQVALEKCKKDPEFKKAWDKVWEED